MTINLPGGSNNDNDVWYAAPTATAAQPDETPNRTGADLRWLDAAFARAPADGVGAVVILAQADMWDPEKGAAHQANFEPFVAKVAAHTLAFGRPVLMFNGDSHVYQSDNPLSLTIRPTSCTLGTAWRTSTGSSSTEARSRSSGCA